MVGRRTIGDRLQARLWIGGLAGVAMYVGHVLAERLAESEVASGTALVVESASFHLQPAVMAVLLAVVVSLFVGVVVDRARAATPLPLVRRFVPTALTLGTVQMIACGGLCLFEHIWFAEDFTLAFFELEVGIALAMQAVVGLVSALLLTLLVNLVRFISKVLRRSARAPRALPLFGARPALPPRVWLLAGGTGVRGPPVV